MAKDAENELLKGFNLGKQSAESARAVANQSQRIASERLEGILAQIAELAPALGVPGLEAMKGPEGDAVVLIGGSRVATVVWDEKTRKFHARHFNKQDGMSSADSTAVLRKLGEWIGRDTAAAPG
jgi:hypothetical protein